jgi:hypothetical protein
MGIKIETISAITLKVVCMETAVEFYPGVVQVKDRCREHTPLLKGRTAG